MYLSNILKDRYETDPVRHRRCSSRRMFTGAIWFYLQYIILVISSGIKFFFVKDPQRAVVQQALLVMRIVEGHGVHLTFEGLNKYPVENGPYVFACNHMSTLEVNALPGLIASRTPMTFVVKSSLLRTPFFGKVLRELEAIPVKRRHPGEDLMQVIRVGEKMLSKGISVILFPEGTRQDVFSPRRFNSLAVKLALRARVQVVPVALKTDFWGAGKLIKEFGTLHRDRRVNITFGDPIRLSGRGKIEQQMIVDFISKHLREWGSPVDAV